MVEDFARILHASALPGLGRSPATRGGFKAWVISGAYAPKLFEQEFLLERVSVEAFTRAVAFDYERFALSSQESRIVALSEREQFGAVSWPLLKQYYSAFFAAHAIMRSRGAGVVRIDPHQAKAVTATMQAYLGGGAKVSSGTYYYTAGKGKDDMTGEITVRFSLSKDGKGVHEGFWGTFIKYLELEAERAASTGLPDNQDFVSFALDLKNSIMSGENAWISKIRNEINYHHEYQSWMPIAKSSASNKAIPRSSGNYGANSRLDICKTKEPIRSFFCVCCYLSDLNYHISNRIAKNSMAGGTFGQRWSRLLASTAVIS